MNNAWHGAKVKNANEKRRADGGAGMGVLVVVHLSMAACRCPRLSDVAMLKLTRTCGLPERPPQAAVLPGLQSLLKCTLTYLHATMCTLQCRQHKSVGEV